MSENGSEIPRSDVLTKPQMTAQLRASAEATERWQVWQGEIRAEQARTRRDDQER